MAKRRTGIDPLAYMGVEPSTPAQFVIDNRDPTTNDYDSFNLQTVWLNRSTYGVWMLVDKADFVATWIQFTANISGLNTLTGNTGGAVPPLAGNINIIGSSPYTVSGNPGTYTLTITDNGSVATLYDADSGSATPAANVLNVVGGTGVTVTGAGNTLTIDASSSNLEIEADAGVPVSPVLDVLQVLGGDNITTTGIAPNIIQAAVSGTTNHAVQVGNAAGSLTSVGPLTTGQLLIGVTGSDPNPARLTAGANITIDDTSTPGQITISSTGGGGGGGGGCSIVAGQTNATLNEVGSIKWFSAGSLFAAPQNGNQSVATETGAFSDMFVNVYTNASTIDTTITFNVNSVNSPIVVTIPALTTGVFSDTTHTANVNQGDLFQFEGSASATGSVTGSVTITFNCAGSSGVGNVKVTTFTSSGTWVKDSQSKWVKVQVIGAGSGGGSGRRGLSGAAAGGSGGGPILGYSIEGPALTFAATEAVVIGAGGTGGAAVAVNNTNGNNGTNGGLCSFGNLITPISVGSRGGGGTATGSPAGSINTNSYLNLAYYNNVNVSGIFAGFNGTATTTPATSLGSLINSSVSGTGGGAGSSAYTVSILSGGAGARWFDVSSTTIIAGGTAGIESGTIDGGNGNTSIGVASTYCNLGGTGGGGGGGQSLGAAAGNGGDGGYPGGAGGGGGGSLNGTNSGAGGDGAAGIIYVYEFL